MTAIAPTLVVGATGKTGRRVLDRLAAAGVPVRGVSRASSTPFEWEDAGTWPAALAGAGSAYITYAPDLAVPAAAGHVARFARLAVEAGLRHLVLLSGRGEPGAVAAESALREATRGSATTWTIVRASWFAQNFTEGAFAGPLAAGELALPAGDVPEPFVDADDVADVAAAALLAPGRHAGQVYELTGPRALTFAEAVATLAGAAGRPMRWAPIDTATFARAMAEEGVPGDVTALLVHLFDEVLDGRNAEPQDGVRRALGREPRDFAAWARAAMAASPATPAVPAAA